MENNNGICIISDVQFHWYWTLRFAHPMHQSRTTLIELLFTKYNGRYKQDRLVKKFNDLACPQHHANAASCATREVQMVENASSAIQ